MSSSDLDDLQSRLAYRFKDIGFLESALTHRSMGPAHNERLEFLGDSIVNFVVAEALFRRYPEAREGFLGMGHERFLGFMQVDLLRPKSKRMALIPRCSGEQLMGEAKYLIKRNRGSQIPHGQHQMIKTCYLHVAPFLAKRITSML